MCSAVKCKEAVKVEASFVDSSKRCRKLEDERSDNLAVPGWNDRNAMNHLLASWLPQTDFREVLGVLHHAVLIRCQ